ncbi:MAG: hypothetical protein PHE58_02000 [Candidatus Omnitrophica bacterium]|nr:hypothetical protein [Candidatus Omnitrophota bacterium]
MDFKELKNKVKQGTTDTLRTDEETYFEAVFENKYLEQVSSVLNLMLGLPAWPSTTKLSRETNEAIKNFGGLRDNQTLYLLRESSYSYFAMFWPWQDGAHTTLKMGQIPAKQPVTK